MKTPDYLFACLNRKVEEMKIPFRIKNTCRGLNRILRRNHEPEVITFYELLEKIKNDDPRLLSIISPQSITEINSELKKWDTDIDKIDFSPKFKQSCIRHDAIAALPIES
ncbi:MAG TPA: hypothetical protein VIH31_00625 [Candidatus Paceibacterota bacterium]|uniref:Uncharacterized protein n=1 Tax=uncultured Parcubacteria bacterium Rifle_16ft_4_minimus_2958 TaxID=1665137 RepID=A0A0H4TMM7_9BACT|nr:hypothetical protein [uncultured Parcubacteria bacterium Rifle_16ft_4_minimus_2958]